MNRLYHWILSKLSYYFGISSNWPKRVYADGRSSGEWEVFHKGKWEPAPIPPYTYDHYTKSFYKIIDAGTVEELKGLVELTYAKTFFDALCEGEESYSKGASLTDNPYETNTLEDEAWEAGWLVEWARIAHGRVKLDRPWPADAINVRVWFGQSYINICQRWYLDWFLENLRLQRKTFWLEWL